MKKINSNDWAPRNKVPYEWSAPIPITNPLIANRNNLYYSLYDEVLFYYILERIVSYNILDEDLYEDD
jgi:hypothetical protein